MLTGIFRGFPLILQTQTIVCFVCDDFLQHADSLHIAQERSKKGDIKEGLLRLKWFNWASLNIFLVRFYLAVGRRLPFFQFNYLPLARSLTFF